MSWATGVRLMEFNWDWIYAMMMEGKTKDVLFKIMLSGSLNPRGDPVSKEVVNISSLEGRGRNCSPGSSRYKRVWKSFTGDIQIFTRKRTEFDGKEVYLW